MIHINTFNSGVAAVAWLVASFGCVTSSLANPPAQTVTLQKQWRTAYNNEDWPAAIAMGKRLSDLQPTDPEPAYNLACAFARSGDVGQGAHWLKVSAQRGWSYTGTMLRDHDLDGVRSLSGYADALTIIKQNNARALGVFKEKADQAIVLEFLPSHYDPSKPAPLIVSLHGYGGAAASFSKVWRGLADEFGAILIVPQGMGRARNGGHHWGRVEEGDFLVHRAIQQAKKKHLIDEDNVIGTGFSQGGSVLFTTALKYPTLFTAVIPVAAFYDHAVAPVPTQPTVKLPRFYIMNGALDQEAGNNRMAANLLTKAGAHAECKIYDGLGHAFPRNRDDELRKALRFALTP